jgi:hypothetical protein
MNKDPISSANAMLFKAFDSVSQTACAFIKRNCDKGLKPYGDYLSEQHFKDEIKRAYDLAVKIHPDTTIDKEELNREKQKYVDEIFDVLENFSNK